MQLFKFLKILKVNFVPLCEFETILKFDLEPKLLIIFFEINNPNPNPIFLSLVTSPKFQT